MASPSQFAVTAVINVRNGEVYLEQTLQSLLAQTQAVNILVIDNHSTDRTAEIARRYPSVRLVQTPEPMTLGAARNFSISQVHSPYVGWIDSDDIWDPFFTDSILNAFSQTPDAVFATAGTVCIDSNGKVIGPSDSYHRKYCVPKWKRDRHRLERGDTFQGIITRMRPKWAWCAHVFRTDAIREVGGFDASLVYSVDLDLIAKLLRLGNAVHVSQNLTRYRRHPQQDTQRQKPEVMYGEKLLVTSRLGRETGLVNAAFLRQIERVTEMKCQVTHFLRERSLLNAARALRALGNLHVLKYYWRLVTTD